MKELFKNYIKRIKRGDLKACGEFLKDYTPYTCKIFREDPFFDKIPSSDSQAKQTILSYIERIRQDETPESYLTEDAFHDFIEQSIQHIIDRQIKKLCNGVYKGDHSAEKRLEAYEGNIFIALQKDRLCDCVPDHTPIAKKVITNLITRIKKDGGEGIDNFYTFLRMVLKRRLIEQYRREWRIVHSDTLPEISDTDKNRIDKGILNKLSYRKLWQITKREFTGLTKEERLILIRTYYNERTCQQIADELFTLTGRLYDKGTITRKRQKALRKLFKGFKKKGIHTIKDLEV